MSHPIPWTRINDFVLDVGSATGEADFHARVLSGVGRLIPFDQDGMCLFHTGKHHHVEALAGDTQRVREFNEHYRYSLPFKGSFVQSHWVTDYRAYESSEFVAEWIRPARIAQSLANRSIGYVVCLSRSRTAAPFSERDAAIHGVVTRHLHNLHSCYRKVAACGRPAITLAELSPECALLSRRESEIVRLMAMRLTAKEAASLLLISPRTVERHVATIYEKLGVNCRRGLLARLYSPDLAAAS